MNTVVTIIIRSLMSFFTLFVYTRILGKKQINQLTFLDYILGISIGTIAGSMTFDLTNSIWLYVLCITSWFAVVFVLQFITLKSNKMARFLGGEPTIVVMNGKIMDGALKKTRLRLSNLIEMLRDKDVYDLSEVEFAIFETSGKLSVLKKSEYMPLTPLDMNVPTKRKGLSTELIYDGIIIDQNLKDLKLDRQWLMDKLNEQNITSISEVFLASLSSDGKLYIDKYVDNIKAHIPGEFSNRDINESQPPK